MINENVSFESHVSFKEIWESDIQKEVSNLNSMKVGTFGNIPTKVLKDSFNICNSILQDIWNYEILGKQYFPKNLKLADILHQLLVILIDCMIFLSPFLEQGCLCQQFLSLHS